MPGSLAKLSSLNHWEIALQTGLGTGILVLILTFTPVRTAFRFRLGNAVVVAALTMLGDAYSHSCHDGIRWSEVILTGLTAGLFALIANFVFEDKAKRLRWAWAAVRRS